MVMNGGGLGSLLECVRGRVTTILPHRDADPDAIASSLLLKNLLEREGITAGIYAPSRNRFTRTMNDILKPHLVQDLEGGCVIITDTSAPNMLPVPRSRLSGRRLFIVDHHRDDGAWKDVSGIVRYLPSNVEVVLELYDEASVPFSDIPRDLALLALVGIYYDTGAFRFAVPGTFHMFWRLTSAHDIPMSEVTGYTQSPYNRSETLAVMKAFQRLRFQEYRGWIIGTSIVGAFEASAARRLVDSGLDIAFVGSEDKKHNIRIASRASETFVDMGGDLTRIISAVKDAMSMDGGGHPGAAGMTGSGDVEAVLNALVEESMRAMNSMGPPSRSR